MLKGNQEFIMIDEQKIAYEKAIDMVRESYLDDKKKSTNHRRKTRNRKISNSNKHTSKHIKRRKMTC